MLKNEKGMVLPLTAVLIPVFLGVIGLMVDVGLMTSNYFRLANAVDSAAYAALDSYDEDIWQDEGTIEINYYEARHLAERYLHANMAGSRLVVFEVSDSGVRVEGEADSPVFFMRLFGFSDRTVRAMAGSSLSEPEED